MSHGPAQRVGLIGRRRPALGNIAARGHGTRPAGADRGPSGSLVAAAGLEAADSESQWCVSWSGAEEAAAICAPLPSPTPAHLGRVVHLGGGSLVCSHSQIPSQSQPAPSVNLNNPSNGCSTLALTAISLRIAPACIHPSLARPAHRLHRAQRAHLSESGATGESPSPSESGPGEGRHGRMQRAGQTSAGH